MVGGWNWRWSATCSKATTVDYTHIGTACAQRYTVRPDLSCGTGLRSRGRSSPGSPKRKSAVPESNRNGAQVDSSRERAGGSFAHQSFGPLPASHPRSQVPQNARRKAAATADRTILAETREAKRLTACCTIPPSGCRPAVPESRAPSRPTTTMWCLAQVHGGPSPVAPPTTMWTRALVLPASWPSPPCAKATAGTVARISDRAMTMCLCFKLNPLVDPADAAAPEPSESAHPGYLRRIGFPSGCHEPWLAGTVEIADYH